MKFKNENRIKSQMNKSEEVAYRNKFVEFDCFKLFARHLSESNTI